MSYGAQIDKWLKDMSFHLKESWGLDDTFAAKVALFYLYCAQYGLSPKLTSGYRSPEKQQQLTARYNAGDKSVVVKPATNSKHSTTDWLGKPAARAIDISTNNKTVAAQIAKSIGIGAGYFYKTPDPVHFYI